MKTNSMPKTKLSIVKNFMETNCWQDAIRIAAKFPDLGKERAAILDAHLAYTNPRFLQQLNKNINEAIENGKLALLVRYGK